MSKDERDRTGPGASSSRLGRREALVGAGAAAIVGGLVLRNQIRHPPRRRRPVIGDRPRRLVLAAAHPLRDPVLLAATHQGIFEHYRLEVSFAGPGFGDLPSGESALEALAHGQADGAVAAALSWLPRLQGGLDARLVCGLQAGSSRLLVPRGSRLRRIEDLRRRAIGITSADGPDRLFFSIMMRRKGMDPDRDVAWRAVPAEALGPALADGTVQAVVGHDPGIWRLRETLHLAELASSLSGSYAARASRLVGLRSGLLREDPAGAYALTLAMRDAARWIVTHREQIAVLLATQDDELTLQQVARMLAAEGLGVQPVGNNLQDQIAQYVDELKLLNMMPQTVESSVVARRFIANVLKA